VTINLTTNQAFDDYAARFGWDYDNGARYRDLLWDQYASSAHRWEPLPDGRVNQVVVILRRGRTTVCAVHFVGRTSTEICSGAIQTSTGFDRLLTVIADYMARLPAKS
jgi:hypothetical protein